MIPLVYEIILTDQNEVAREKLLKDMKRTKGVRFNASKRVEESEVRATKNTAYASVAVIVVTLLPVFFSMTQFLENSIALLTVALSIFILASSLIRSSNSGLVKAEQFQRCALEVNSLRRELDSSPKNANLPEFAAKYDEILKRYNINHEQSDYDQYRLEHPDEFPEYAQEELKTARDNLKQVNRITNSISISIVVATLIAAATAILSAPEVSDALGKIIGAFKSL